MSTDDLIEMIPIAEINDGEEDDDAKDNTSPVAAQNTLLIPTANGAATKLQVPRWYPAGLLPASLPQG